MGMNWHKADYSITTDKSKMDVHYIHAFLRTSYWAQKIPLDVVERSIQGSLCFAILHENKQIGFARVITDEATFAYLADVFVDPAYRGRGLSKWLMEVIMSYPSLQGLRRFMLATRDAHGLYSQFGFRPMVVDSNRYMHIHNPEVYGEGQKNGKCNMQNEK
jgi:N-acetylglutamate synthase-like GNAT family acetyltransferase